LPPTPLVAEKAHAAIGTENEISHTAGHAHSELEVVVGQLALDLLCCAIEEQGHVGAGRFVHLPDHEYARLCRRLPVDVAERLTRLVGPHSSELRGPEGAQSASACPVVLQADFRIEDARIEMVDAREHCDDQRLADVVLGFGEAEVILGYSLGPWQHVHPSVDSPDAAA